MTSICEFLVFVGEEGGMFHNLRLPTLDTEIWLDEVRGKVMYSFYEKPTCPKRVVQKDTALSEPSIRATLMRETIRLLKNCIKELPLDGKKAILSIFAQKMLNSGHSLSSIQYILVHGVIKYVEMLKMSELDPPSPNYKPIHPSRHRDVFRRKPHKLL